MISQGKTILVVEDDASMLGVLVDNLKAEGFAVLEATNGEDGLNAALKEHPDLILLDIMMPQMNGLTMLEKLRSDDWGRAVPVIILTNFGDNEKVAEALGDDVSDYFIKSDIKLEEVIAKVKQKLKV